MSRPENQLRLNPETPFPGLSYYEEKDCNYFFGREAETDELFRLVRRAPLTVLFGQSGLGKTSLIQAGLFPLLRDAHYLPIPIRIDFGAEAPALEQQVYLALENASALANAECEKLQAGESLWEYFHRVHIWSARNRLLIPALVFDQFEEIFTLGRNEPRTGIWLQALADLIENRIPQSLRLRIETGREAPDYAYDNLEIKVLLALREDFLPDLEDLRSLMPSLAANRMRLAALDGERALDVVHHPAPELISPAVAEEIVRFVAGGEKLQDSDAELKRLPVEPSLLNLVCQQLNRRRIAEGVPAITADLLRGNKDRLLSDFYADCLHDLPQSLAVFVEEQLITPSGFRRAETLENALNMPGVEPVGLMTLVNRRLLRREERFGIPHLELIHDVLTATIRENRDRRRAEAKKEAERRREAELLVKLQISRRHTLASVALVIFLLGGIAFYYFGFFYKYDSYAKDYVKIRGQARPVAAIPHTAVKHRSMTYRFTSKGWFGKMLKMETIGANHQLVGGHLGTYLSDREQTPLEEITGVEFVYDDKGRVVTEISRNQFGRMVWGFLYVPLDDQDKNTRDRAKAMFLGPDGYPQPQGKSSAEFIEFTYNDDDYETGRQYTDREGNPAPGPNNAYGQSREYDDHGQGYVIRLTSLNSQGQAMNDLAGNAGQEFIYEDGNIIGWWAFDANKEPTLVNDGYYGKKIKYDRWGRKTEECFFGLNKVQPVADTSIGAHCIARDYDDSGNVTSTRLYGTANERVIAKGNFAFPAHEERKIYDPQNRNVQKSYFDAKEKGEPLADPDDGWHSVRYEYDDEHGFLLAKSYWNKLDKPFNLTTSGFHRWEYVRDPFGMPVEERFFDDEHKPFASLKRGYHLSKKKYNKVGKQVEESFFSVHGDHPVVDLIDGYHRAVLRVDRLGNWVLMELFDEKNQPVNNKPVCHRFEGSYNEFGSGLSQRWYDKNGTPCKGSDGAEYVKYSYNPLGKNTQIVYYDANGQPVVNKYGVYEYLSEYNGKGLITRRQWFGLNKRPVEYVYGIHLALYDYDKPGRQTKTAYIDKNNRLVIGPDGYAESTFNYESDGGSTVTLYGIDGKPRLNSLWGWAIRKRDSQDNTTAYYGADGALINGPKGYAEVRRHWHKDGVLQDEAYFGPDGHPVAGPDGYHRKQSLSTDQPSKFSYFNTENLEIPLPEGSDAFVTIHYIGNILDVTQVAAKSLQAGDILWRYGQWSFSDAWAAERLKGTPFNGISGAVFSAFLAERDRLRAEKTVITVIRNGKMVNIPLPPLGKKIMGFEPETRLIPIDTFKAWQAGAVEIKTGG